MVWMDENAAWSEYQLGATDAFHGVTFKEDIDLTPPTYQVAAT